jgi:hypothetical protein
VSKRAKTHLQAFIPQKIFRGQSPPDNYIMEGDGREDEEKEGRGGEGKEKGRFTKVLMEMHISRPWRSETIC